MLTAQQQMLVRQDSRVSCAWQVAFSLGALREGVGDTPVQLTLGHCYDRVARGGSALALDQASQRNPTSDARDPFDQSLPGYDGAWSARNAYFSGPAPLQTSCPTAHPADAASHPPRLASKTSSRPPVRDPTRPLARLAPRALRTGPTPVGFPIRSGG